MKQITELYQRWTGEEPAGVECLAGAGSNRQYYRITNTKHETVIGVVGNSQEENRAFIYLARHFEQQQLPMPRVLAVSDDEMCYLQTDLGDCALFDALKEGREKGGCYNTEEERLLEDTIKALPRIQMEGAKGLDWSYCYPQPSFNSDNVHFDLNYFKYCFLKLKPIDFNEMQLEEDFKRMANDLTRCEGEEGFMYRDFQARNVMLDAEGNPSFIDFQGGRKGPFYYDLASFLWQASARYSEELRNELIDTYYNELQHYTAVPPKSQFRARLALFVLFRTLQVLGAYGFRGYMEHKQHFIDSIPHAINNVRQLLEQPAEVFPYPYLRQVLNQLTLLPEFAPSTKESSRVAKENSPIAKACSPIAKACSPIAKENSPIANESFSHVKEQVETTTATAINKPALVVRVFSFSYRKGIPEDCSGNGGGYVFDCRSTHNPGRYEPYKKLTGLDCEVIKFLEDDGEILAFLDNVYPLADRHVARYIERGFTDLMFSFGCTGGQHRSVYCAQHLAEHLHKKFNIEVRLEHREQGIKQTFK